MVLIKLCSVLFYCFPSRTLTSHSVCFVPFDSVLFSFPLFWWPFTTSYLPGILQKQYTLYQNHTSIWNKHNKLRRKKSINYIEKIKHPGLCTKKTDLSLAVFQNNVDRFSQSYASIVVFSLFDINTYVKYIW